MIAPPHHDPQALSPGRFHRRFVGKAHGETAKTAHEPTLAPRFYRYSPASKPTLAESFTMGIVNAEWPLDRMALRASIPLLARVER